jgi:hypothetical protein
VYGGLAGCKGWRVGWVGRWGGLTGLTGLEGWLGWKVGRAENTPWPMAHGPWAVPGQ